MQRLGLLLNLFLGPVDLMVMHRIDILFVFLAHVVQDHFVGRLECLVNELTLHLSLILHLMPQLLMMLLDMLFDEDLLIALPEVDRFLV